MRDDASPDVGLSAVDGLPSEPSNGTTVARAGADQPAHGTSGASAPDLAQGGSTAAAATRTRRLLHGIRELVIVVVIALVASALLRAFVLQAFFVPSGSMLPEIQKDDRILVSRINTIERGEIVVFRDPGNWLDAVKQPPPPTGLRKGLEWLGVLPASGHEHLVKRVIGLEGDRIICCEGGQLVVNGVSVDESSHLFQKKGPADDQTYDVVVPDDHVFVLGDHRYGSGDSAYHLQDETGFVPVDLVVGRAFSVIWPVGDAHLMRIPDVYDEVPTGQAPPDEAIVKPLRRTPR